MTLPGVKKVQLKMNFSIDDSLAGPERKNQLAFDAQKR